MATTDGADAKRSGDSASANGDNDPFPETVGWDAAGAKMPEQLGRYRVKGKLGGGGMGAVYWVENTELRRDEALKVPHFDTRDDPMVRERFLREARVAARLDHPNLCPIYDVGVIDGIYFLTMRLIQGESLSAYTQQAQPPPRAIEIVVKLAQALEYAHARGVIHRDLKPSNVMMCAEAGPTVLDFGLAKQLQQSDKKLTQTGTMVGTPSYMPPEQIKGDMKRIGPASDVYSLGVILFELLTGRLPFEGGQAEVLGKVLYADAPLPSHLRPEVGSALDAICGKAMARAPEDRYASMKAFADVLLEVLQTIAPKRANSSATQDVSGVLANPAPALESTMASQRSSLSPAPLLKAVPADDPTQKQSRRSHQAPLPSRPESRGQLGLMVFLFLLVVGVGAVVILFAGGMLDPGKYGAIVGLGHDKEITNSIGMQMVRIPAGKFTMGSPRGEADRGKDEEQHAVEITKAFWMGAHEVSQGRFKEVMGYNPSYFSKDGAGKPGLTYRDKPAGGKANVRADTSEFPVENVSWDEAKEFCEKLTKKEGGGRTYRLPTEAEWEYACRGGANVNQVYHYGNSLGSTQANFDGNSPSGGAAKGDYLERTCKIGSYKANAFGLYDMHGNVWEWCADWYDLDYGNSSPRDPAGPLKGSFRVRRGGSWNDEGRYCRSAFRYRFAPGDRDSHLGFRAVLVPPGQ